MGQIYLNAHIGVYRQLNLSLYFIEQKLNAEDNVCWFQGVLHSGLQTLIAVNYLKPIFCIETKQTLQQFQYIFKTTFGTKEVPITFYLDSVGISHKSIEANNF